MTYSRSSQSLVVISVSMLMFSIAGCGSDERRTSSTFELEPSTGSPKEPEPEPAPAPDPSPDELAVHLEVFRLTNEFRVENGRAPLTWNDRLYEAAQGHAEAMATQGFFSHVSLDGRSAGTRIRAEGYDWTTWGENIAYGYKTAAAVVQAWINSPGHRANMLSTSFRDLGVGYEVRKSSSGATGTAYWVQDFGRQ